MKKNKMMRTASALLVATLLSTSVIAGTFAKYTTSAEGSDTARVAKWGVTATVSGSLYSDAYVAGTNAGVPGTWATSGDTNTLTVASKTEHDNIVAPGTKSTTEGMQFGLAGSPEVAVKISATIKARDIMLKSGYSYAVMTKVDVDDENFAEMKAADNLYTKTNSTYKKVATEGVYATGDYYVMTSETQVLNDDYTPVVYSLTGNTGGNGTADTVAAALAKAVKNSADVETSEIQKNDATLEKTYTVSSSYATNTDLATAGPKLGNEKLTWAWAFSDENGTNDAKDTILGNLMQADASGAFNTTTYVVAAKSTDGTLAAYSDVTVDTTNNVAKSDNDIIANLITSFNISITAEQVD